MEFDITLIIAFVVGLLFGLVSQGSQVLAAFIRSQKARIPQEWHWALDDVAAIAVRAAEQIWLNHKGEAFNRLDYAKDIVSSEAARLGIVYDEAMITALIEAKVYELFKSDTAASG